MTEVVQHLQIALLAVILGLNALWLAYRWHFFKCEKRPSPPVTLKIALQLFTLFLSFQLIFVPLIISIAYLLTGQKLILSAEAQGWFTLFAIAIMGVVLYTYSYFHWDKLRPLFYSAHIGKDLLLGVATWVLSFPLVILLTQLLTILLSDMWGYSLTDQLAVKQIKITLEHPPLFACMVLAVTLFVPIMEEFLFRGILQSALRVYMQAWPTIVISSLIFALFHFSFDQGINNITIVASLFLLSLFLGFLRERQGNLWPCIALHVTFNAISILMIITQVAD